jgi:hypothetical protein
MHINVQIKSVLANITSNILIVITIVDTGSALRFAKCS